MILVIVEALSGLVFYKLLSGLEYPRRKSKRLGAALHRFHKSSAFLLAMRAFSKGSMGPIFMFICVL